MSKATTSPSFEDRDNTIIRLYTQGYSVSQISTFVRTSTDIISGVLSKSKLMEG